MLPKSATCMLLTTLLTFILSVHGFSTLTPSASSLARSFSTPSSMFVLSARKGNDDIPTSKITAERRKKLGIADNEDEYDLGMAL
jgi:hypothetical protein